MGCLAVCVGAPAWAKARHTEGHWCGGEANTVTLGCFLRVASGILSSGVLFFVSLYHWFDK